MSELYAAPQIVTDPAECFFYHRMELPGYGLVGGDWDLQKCAAEYLGNVDFKGKRALDMGAASGFLSFEMEKRGADVVAFDLDDGANWDIVPHYKLRQQLPEMRAAMTGTLERLKNGFWLSHRAMESKVKAHYGNIYALPKELGDFDVVLFGMILTHLRDPFHALYQGARLCTDTMIVTGIFGNTDQPTSTFRPAGDKTGNLDVKGWWLLSRGTIRGMLGALGFKIEQIVNFEADVLAVGNEGPRQCQAIVARRIAG